MQHDTRDKIFEYIFKKADEIGYMGLDSAESNKFQDTLQNDINLQKIAGENLSRNYIKDTVLNNYSKKQRYITIDDVASAFTDVSHEQIHGSKRDFENGIFSIVINTISIDCTSSSFIEWQTVIKRFGARNNELIRFAFLTCGGIEKNKNEINDIKKILKSYDIQAFIVKPTESPVSIKSFLINLKATKSVINKNNETTIKSNNHFLSSSTPLPKPFLLLAGISGTGKSRFVRQQAEQHRADSSNFCLIAVRPDWHEPSDLLGYISRIGGDGQARYVVTDLLKFMVDAWLEAMESVSDNKIKLKPIEAITPFWLCLDEMNLAPVEQYFADYLAIIETREWANDEYSCQPLLKKASLDQVEYKQLLRENLGLNASHHDELWAYFLANGIALPPNLIVAGTVNMDETTHGFSRKVIDRAFTIDFGVFYPNDFNSYFQDQKDKIQTKTLSFPLLSKVTTADLADCLADSDGSLSIGFLTAINKVLKDTPFELAYRALNELLLAVVSFAPQDARQLQAVWDDFLMSKLLPRIDGDGEKLQATENGSLLTQLSDLLEIHLSAIWATNRPDLLRENFDGSACEVECRSKAKLQWMQDRLKNNGFTSFWP